MTALKKPNILVSWNLDNGKVIHHQKIDSLNFKDFKKFSDWNGTTLLKQMKAAKT